MIIVRAPLRISFVGGGSDLPEFYKLFPGRVLSATIDKYVYAGINPAPLLKGITARYSIVENVKNVEDLKNDRIRESMLYFNIRDNMEFGVFSDLPIGTGLGGSSSFAVALVKGLSTYLGKRLDKQDVAEAACEVEIIRLKEPIGKQDQYTSSFGGFNIFQFNPDETVEVEQIFLDYKRRIDLENQILVFFSGITRKASTVLKEQKANMPDNLTTLKSMVKLVEQFRKNLVKGKFENLGKLLHESWLMKKKLATKISNQAIDEIYHSAVKSGAWGGKLLGAGGGGCILFLVPSKDRADIKQKIIKRAEKLGLSNFKEVPVKFVQSGVEIVSDTWN